jgi:hypothetical protein
VKIARPDFLVTGAFISALFTFCIFFIAKNNQFVALDDYAYIVNNSNISTFNLNTVAWCLSSFYEGNWHPLTMLTLAFDHYIWGNNASGYHFSNIIIHCCSVFSSCFLFSRLLRAYSNNSVDCMSIKQVSDPNLFSQQISYGHGLDRPFLSELSLAVGSIAAALFFGLHPLRVESVVWASERKDVLCMFFLILALLMYMRYTSEVQCEPRIQSRISRSYFLSVIFAALAQMSKPTAVSIPLILCILDWYPNKRFSGNFSSLRLLIEKIPFFIIAVIGSILTLVAQQVAMKYAPVVGMVSRLLVACKALLYYIAITVWPINLTAFYPHPGNVATSALAEYSCYLLLIVFISFVAAKYGHKYPQFQAFWLFYVISLVPMLGIIQVGGQWAADRYSYLPSLGISLLWGGSIANLFDYAYKNNLAKAARICIALAVCQLLFYTSLTLRQILVWRNTETLASRIINVIPHTSGAPYMARAIYRNESGQFQAALEDIGIAMKIALQRRLNRTYPDIAFVQAVILKNLGRYREALTIMEWGLETSVDPPPPDAVKLRHELERLMNGPRH